MPCLRGHVVLHINLKVDLGTWLSTAGAFPLLSGTCQTYMLSLIKLYMQSA